ncbi:bifunctional metallophosphatase/5'-nucleotidase [Exiguobacterium sp. SH3S2]|uniref:bifunctional metallophosphatase/5'-nucleotidase n=1 Tax=unclassified Exiguobacterium TaxID=2644629 RepID=UPI00103D9462|nr:MULTISPECIES: 5'-nucleotidase C-terminal domain-containing protein [unclassified Exiguobacterium]TCI46129.1 bifunctional metallophosphatase/5'-nucleotidase [Exiguobacterium sp. SH3S3]TCI61217.1 bifunctional metallophosphatase/5'-nucleotidase [Exiguobacterium sp. SH3S2]
MFSSKSERLFTGMIAAALAVSTVVPAVSVEAKQSSKATYEAKKTESIEILLPDTPLVFKQGEKITGRDRIFNVRIGDQVRKQPVKLSNLSTSTIGEYTVKATYTHKGERVTVDVPYKVEGFKLAVMHTNDTHASLDSSPKRATAINQLRQENVDRLLIDAGDVFSGSLYFNEFKGQADLALMNYMDYDLMVPGNHEFDLGTEAGHQEFAAFVENAEFPFVSSNVDYSADQYLNGLYSNKIERKPYDGKLYEGVIKVVDGKKVGFFGLTTEDTANIASPGPIKFQDYIDEAEKAVKAFKQRGVDQIVAVSHLGFDDNPAIDNDLELAKRVEGIDVIIGGHSHSRLDAPVVVVDGDEPTVIVQAYQYGEFLGTLDVEFDQTGKVIAHQGKLIDIKGYAADPTAVSLLAPFASEIESIRNAEIGATTTAAFDNPRDAGDVTKPSVRKNETALGNLITDGMLDRAKQVDGEVVAAIQNAGGIRASINAGPVTTGEVLTTLPFGNTLAVMTLQGSELLSALERSVSVYPIESGGFLHMSGMKIEFDSSKAANNRIVKAQVLRNGQYVDVVPSENYKIATNFFAAKGGDNYLEFKKAYEEGRVNDLGIIDWEIMRDYLVKLKTVTPTVEGRVVDIKQ